MTVLDLLVAAVCLELAMTCARAARDVDPQYRAPRAELPTARVVRR